MSFKPSRLTLVVFLKEMRETLRDKRVLLGVIVSPLLLTPALIAAIGFFAGQKTMDMRRAEVVAGVYQESDFTALRSYLEDAEKLRVQNLDSREAAEAAIVNRELRAALIFPAGANDDFEKGGSVSVEILYDQANERSENAKNRLMSLIRSFNQEAVKSRLAGAGLPPTFVRPTAIVQTSLADQESVGGFILSMILPYLVVISAAFGGINTAFDIGAGEKERGTMETLLVSPASRYEIVQGKLFTIFSISLLSSCCALLGIILPIVSGLALFKEVLGTAIAFDVTSILAMLLIVVPLALLTSSALLVVSSFARNQKEAQAYIFPFISVVIFPAVLSTILGAESPLFTAFIPVLNITLTMKQILGNVFDFQYFAISLVTSLVYALAAMRLAASLFQRESILFRA